MTINVTLFAPNAVIQGADRRISMLEKRLDDRNKITVLLSERLKISVTYTGIASSEYPGDLYTDAWLVDVLSDRSLAAATIDGIALGMKDAANKRPRANGPRTIFTIAGWDIDQADAQPVGAQVHNCLDKFGRLQKSRPEFEVSRLDGSKHVHFAGIPPPQAKTCERLLDRMIRTGRSQERIIEQLVSTVRSTSAKHAEQVSPDVTLVALPPEGEHAYAAYYPRGQSGTQYPPNLVVCRTDTGVHQFADIQIRTWEGQDEPPSLPWISRQVPRGGTKPASPSHRGPSK